MKVMRRWWNVTLFTRKIEKHSRHPSLQGSDSRPARKIGKVENEWIDEDDRIERDIAYQREGRTERLAGKRSSILENRKNVDYIPFFEPCLNKEARLSNQPGQTLANIPYSRITLTLEEDKGYYDLSCPALIRVASIDPYFINSFQDYFRSPEKEIKKRKKRNLGDNKGNNGEERRNYNRIMSSEWWASGGDLLMLAKIEKRRKKKDPRRTRYERVIMGMSKRERAGNPGWNR